MSIGNRLKILRERDNVTQKEVAFAIGKSVGSVGMYEIDERVPSPEVLSKLADFYKVSVDYLLGREQPNYILAAHRKGGISELPEEAQKELENYVEYLRAKYKR